MSNRVSGIIIKTSYDKVGDTSSIQLFGKTMLQWVSLAMQGTVATVSYNEKLSVPLNIRPYLDPESEYTVVLYSDTPLITAKTVSQAVKDAVDTGANVIKMTRGFVFKTEFVQRVDKIYSVETHYYEEEDFITAVSFKQIAMISDIMRTRILSYHMRNGVMIEDPASTFIGSGVSIGKGVRISPNNIISGNTVIKDNARIDAGNNIDSCIIESGAYMLSSRAVHSYIGKNVQVGPYANIREDNVIGENCKIGDFVELKKCHIGNGCKISHLSYLGDVIMGSYCNVGAGVVFANYDGKNKHTTMVGNSVFVGSKATIVAPVTLSDNSFISAGSTITNDVSPGALAIGRARQVEKPDWKGNLYINNNRHE